MKKVKNLAIIGAILAIIIYMIGRQAFGSKEAPVVVNQTSSREPQVFVIELTGKLAEFELDADNGQGIVVDSVAPNIPVSFIMCCDGKDFYKTVGTPGTIGRSDMENGPYEHVTFRAQPGSENKQLLACTSYGPPPPKWKHTARRGAKIMTRVKLEN